MLCGRYRIAPSEMWEMTIGEFVEVVVGGREAEREQALGFAQVVSTIMGALGSPMSALAIIGEESEYGASPFGAPDEDREHRLRLRREAEDATAARLHRAWMPEEIASQDE